MPAPTERKALSHIERTATEPRDDSLHKVVLTRIDQINPEIRLLRLSPAIGANSFTFLPGQWLDVHVPTVDKPGGFTITSPPSLLASTIQHPYFELAIQRSPTNPPADWLWKPEKEILGSELQVRVGGSFVWPPKFYGEAIKRVVFVAGGVGINPLMSILSHLSHLSKRGSLPFEIKFLYSLRDLGGERSGDTILFMERLVKIFHHLDAEGSLQVFLTGGNSEEGIIECNENAIGFKGKRIGKEDLMNALGNVQARQGTLVYICGVPEMTDEFVEAAKEAEGMDKRHVLCEKWW